MDFFRKQIENINFSDINDLVINEVPESYDLDYKEDYPEKNKLPKLMVALSNSTGGYIIIGVKCKSGSNIPEEICGVHKGEHKTRITGMAYSNSQPKIWPNVRIIENENDPDKDIVVIRVDEANEPIMYTRGNKFPIRINDKIEYADQALVRKLFSKRNIYKRIEEKLEEVHSKQKNRFSNIASKDSGNRYVGIGFCSIPFHRGNPIFNLNNKETEEFIKSLYRKISYGLTGRLYRFNNYIRDFNYMGNNFQANFDINERDKKIFSNFKIFDNGILTGEILLNLLNREYNLPIHVLLQYDS